VRSRAAQAAAWNMYPIRSVKAYMRWVGAPPILMYHSIAPYAEDPYLITVRPERFEQQMRWLRRIGCRGVSVRKLLEAAQSGVWRGLVGLSFDDGYADFLEYALPTLQRHGFSATAYVLGGRFGGHNEWDADAPRKPLVTAQQVRQIAAAGIEIGSHGLQHVSLPALDDSTLRHELGESRRVLQEISGQEVDGFCYPFGHVDSRLVTQVRAAGYAYACATERSELSGPLALPRVFMTDFHSPPHLIKAGVKDWLRWEYRGPGWRYLHGSAAY
jgi:peptidoglycan/xylan/chitin deacetylase (PgdA/CDA1 family)